MDIYYVGYNAELFVKGLIWSGFVNG